MQIFQSEFPKFVKIWEFWQKKSIYFKKYNIGTLTQGLQNLENEIIEYHVLIKITCLVDLY